VAPASAETQGTAAPAAHGLVRRYYAEVWNAWNARSLEELIAPEIVFRGSIGTEVHGIEEFREYVNRIRAAFPDFHNQVEELIGEGASVAARLTYTGTHRGEILGFGPSGARIRYQGIAVFHIANGKIVEGNVLGDVAALKRQLLQGEIAATLQEMAGVTAMALATQAEEEWAAALMSSSEPWRTLRRNYEQSLTAMREASHHLLVAHGGDGAPVGFLLVHLDGVAGSPYIRSIAVAEAHRGTGIGAGMLEFAHALFRRRARHVFLCVSSFNPRARALYERMGYEMVGEFEGYVVPEASEVLMRKRL